MSKVKITSITIPIISLANDLKKSFDSFSNSSITGPDQISATNQLISIYNLSATSYFVPNKTAPEWTAFKNHSPKYVAVSVCGDGICQTGTVTERYSQFNSENTTNWCGLVAIGCWRRYRPVPTFASIRIFFISLNVYF